MAELIRVDDVALRPWRNGGGQTRELLTWPLTDRHASDQCDLRIAVADIEGDGPFSSYEGIERWIVVISGNGIALTFSDGERELVRGDEPLCFDGAAAPDCRLLKGPTRDLNLMVRGGRGAMRAARSSVPWTEDFAMRGLFAAESGKWVGAGESRDIPALTLLWSDAGASGAWTFEYDEPNSGTQAWWLGFTPSEWPHA